MQREFEQLWVMFAEENSRAETKYIPFRRLESACFRQRYRVAPDRGGHRLSYCRCVVVVDAMMNYRNSHGVSN